LDKTAKLKINGNSRADLQDALRVRFELPASAQFNLVDHEGYDVVLDQHTAEGNYTLHLSSVSSIPVSGGSGSGVYMELKPQLKTTESKEVFAAQKVLRLGDSVPNFQADSSKGKIDLYEYLGNSWGILFSHPRDFTPVCTTELSRAAKLKGEWAKRNTKVLGLSVDTAANHEGWAKDIDECFGGTPDFPLVADHDRKISVEYGMLDQSEIDGKGLPLTVRSVFFIDPKKLIRAKIDYPASTGRNFNEIIRVLDSLQLVSQYQVATPSDWQQGGEVVVLATLTDDRANELFPKGFRKLKPYLRLTPDPTS